MDFTLGGGDNLRRITVINLDSLSEEHYKILEGLFGTRYGWPVFVWDVKDEQWARDSLTKPLDASDG